MKSFWKGLTGKAKTDLSKRFVAIVVALVLFVGSAVLLMVSFSSVAWFSNNSSVNANGMQVVVNADTYSIYVDRNPATNRYTTANVNKYPNVNLLVDSSSGALVNDGYSLTDTTGSSLALELVNEYEFDGYSLMPGSYGYLSFYVKPVSGDVSLTFDLSFAGYDVVKITDENDNETTKLEAVDDSTLFNYLRGHILFFDDREGSYSQGNIRYLSVKEPLTPVIKYNTKKYLYGDLS